MEYYVTVIALTDQNELILVRQYRPAVERYTLELPSGHVGKNETPETAARRELAEECGLEAATWELLGSLLSDTGRNENRLWCYFASGVTATIDNHVQESGVERILLPRERLRELISSAEFGHALDLAVIMLFVVKHGLERLALR
jgi:ADP-ribose pyrophosphatase